MFLFLKCITLRFWVFLAVVLALAFLGFLLGVLVSRHAGGVSLLGVPEGSASPTSGHSPARDAPGIVSINAVRPDAPELARLQRAGVGVRTMEFINPDQLDVEALIRGVGEARSDRPLPVEIWYPATGEGQGSLYEVTGRDGNPLTLRGSARRDAPADYSRGPFPLVILSHGYPGSRFLLSHFGEFLAGIGYVVVSIDHTGSTYTDQGSFAGTLRNRPLDQNFVLHEVDRLSREGAGTFLEGLVDPERTGIIGYSMGGYGVLNALGAGLSDAVLEADFAPPGALQDRLASFPGYSETVDPRVRAAVVIAPWGVQVGLWDAPALEKIRVPLFFMAGTADSVSGYDEGPRAAFLGTRGTSRYLLSYEQAGHAVAAPFSVPAEVWAGRSGFGHYADPLWDTLQMNNIAHHFVAAFFGEILKGDPSMARFLRHRSGQEETRELQLPRGTRLEFLREGEEG
ncbi:hypothetical protein AU468_05815 [Alkalispirochaeta sphaeroplastigenens]|uniref:PET hydrolase/cutinase-like domain-containing protein n=1 Tax=Alkalispirochaeta sphaeroplastigenens TaxID=1187066 RepID=A0A2S4JU78_9SPIO|nr:dienelactone hydrolase [Alkalispirochaeta sphaeroplastigenens]POR03071.1 hypothetical protein AU468_05815 [Alkalispirochaeta sphaeroplastigenens]